MSKKLIFLSCLPWDSAALVGWANALARDGLEPRRIPAALPFLAIVGDGSPAVYTLTEPHRARRDQYRCRVPWVNACLVRGRPAEKYPYGGARRRALNFVAALMFFCYFALVLTMTDTAAGLGWLFGETELPALVGALRALNALLILVTALSSLICFIQTVRVRYGAVCRAAFAVTVILIWLWIFLRVAILILI